MDEIQVIQPGTRRVKIFVDFWNLIIEARSITSRDVDFVWDALPDILIAETKAGYLDKSQGALAGCFIFGSFDKSNPSQMKLVDRTLDRYGASAGLFFEFKERIGKETNQKCGKCGSKFVRSGESGVDVLLTIEMVKHALMRDHDYIALVSNDRDYLPLLHYLKDQGQRVLHIATGEPLREMRAASWKQFELRQLYANLVSIYDDARIVLFDPNTSALANDAAAKLAKINKKYKMIDICDREKLNDKELIFLLKNQGIFFSEQSSSQRWLSISHFENKIYDFRKRLASGEISGRLPHVIKDGRPEAYWLQNRWTVSAGHGSPEIWHH